VLPSDWGIGPLTITQDKRVKIAEFIVEIEKLDVHPTHGLTTLTDEPLEHLWDLLGFWRGCVNDERLKRQCKDDKDD